MTRARAEEASAAARARSRAVEHPHECQPRKPGGITYLNPKTPHIAKFKDTFGDPTDVDAVWRARELHQDDQECLTRLADIARCKKRITS